MICQRPNVPVRDAMTIDYGTLELVGTGKLLSNESFKLLSFLFHCEFVIMIANSFHLYV